MESYHIIKERREAAGLTVRELCEKVNISMGAYVEYQNGTKSLLCLPLDKAVCLFSAIDIDPEQFYEKYFPQLREEIVQKMEKWRLEHPLELDFDKLKRRYKARIAKAKERKSLQDMDVECLLRDLRDTFNALEPYVDEKGMISEKLYEERVRPFFYTMRKKLESGGTKNEVADQINDAILRSEMTYAEMGSIVNVTPRRLTMCKNSPEGYSNMKIGSVLKICYALNLPFGVIQTLC